MASRISPGELALTQAQHLNASGYKEQAHDFLNEYFAKLRIRSWDPVHDRLAQLALSLSAELHQPTKALHSHVRFSVDYALDVLPATLKSYIDKCNSKVEEEQKRAESEESKTHSSLLKGVDMPKLLKESIVTPVIDFLFNALHQILSELVKQLGKYDELYHDILRKSFKLCVKYNRFEDVELFSNDLSYYRGHNEPKGEVVLRYIKSQYARYKAAAELNLMNQALAALSEANDMIKMNYPLVPTERIEKVERAKHSILKKGEYQLFTAIQHQNLYEFYKANPKQGIDLEKMSDMVLIEIITSPLNGSTYDYSTLINFPRFLNQTSGNIPNRSDLIVSQLESKKSSTLTEFVKFAEFGTDPFEICNKFIEFKNKYSKEDYFQDFESKLLSYAAIRTIQVIRNHYSSIDFDELSEIISWIPIEKIQEIIVDAARQSLIPVHINMMEKSIEFNPRGNQCLESALSPLNDQLCNIFDEFQNIKKRLPEDIPKETNKVKENHEIYLSESNFRNRMNTLKERRKKQDEEKKKREAEKIKEEREIQKQREKEEIRKREEEKERKKERDACEEKYNRFYTEAKIIARDNHVDFQNFLDTNDENVPKYTGVKYNDVDWIEYKNKQIKKLAIQRINSENNAIAEKMKEIKEAYAKGRIKLLLSQKQHIENSYESEVELMKKLKDMHKNMNSKSFELEKRNYLRMCKLCKDSLDDFTAFVIQIKKENEKSGLGTKQQPPLPQSLQEQPKESDIKEKERKEDIKKKEGIYQPVKEIPSRQSKEEPSQSPQEKPFTPEEKQAPYKPPTNNKTQEEKQTEKEEKEEKKPAPYKPPTEKEATEEKKPAPYKPPTGKEATEEKKPAPYKPPTGKETQTEKPSEKETTQEKPTEKETTQEKPTEKETTQESTYEPPPQKKTTTAWGNLNLNDDKPQNIDNNSKFNKRQNDKPNSQRSSRTNNQAPNRPISPLQNSSSSNNRQNSQGQSRRQMENGKFNAQQSRFGSISISDNQNSPQNQVNDSSNNVPKRPSSRGGVSRGGFNIGSKSQGKPDLKSRFG